MWELDHDPVLPAGYRGLRGAILLALKKAQPLTAGELAAEFGVSSTALRRHLKLLEEDGVIGFRREVRGVGAPAFVYSLTPAGEGLFPRAYSATLVDAIGALRESGGTEGVRSFFRRRWERLTEETAPLLRTLPLHERVQLLSELMTAHGYMSESAAVEGEGTDVREVTLTSRNCPLRAVAESCSEACEVEHQYLGAVLDAHVERKGRIVEGCNACSYIITRRHRSPVRLRRARSMERREPIQLTAATATAHPEDI